MVAPKWLNEQLLFQQSGCIHVSYQLCFNDFTKIYVDCYATPLNLQQAMALWLLKSREVHKIPLSVMDGIAKDMQSIFDSVTYNFQHDIHSILHEAVNLDEAKNNITKYMSNVNLNLLQGLQSNSAQLQYFRKHFNLVVSFYDLTTYN